MQDTQGQWFYVRLTCFFSQLKWHAINWLEWCKIWLTLFSFFYRKMSFQGTQGRGNQLLLLFPHASTNGLCVTNESPRVAPFSLFFLNIIALLRSTYHTIQPHKMLNSMVFSIFTVLCKLSSWSLWGHFHDLQKKPCILY